MMQASVAKPFNANNALNMNDFALVNEPLYSEFFAKLLSAQRENRGVLPFFLGLQPLELMWFAQCYLPETLTDTVLIHASGNSDSEAWQRGQLRQELLDMRRDEWLDVRDLLLAHRSDASHPLVTAMASIVAAGCLGGDHLWRDLGLLTRAELSDLMTLFFPTLAVKNSKDMKWKKFFYKQLCEQEGGYVCRAPSCEQCAAYDDCFGEEV